MAEPVWNGVQPYVGEVRYGNDGLAYTWVTSGSGEDRSSTWELVPGQTTTQAAPAPTYSTAPAVSLDTLSLDDLTRKRLDYLKNYVGRDLTAAEIEQAIQLSNSGGWTIDALNSLVNAFKSAPAPAPLPTTSTTSTTSGGYAQPFTASQTGGSSFMDALNTLTSPDVTGPVEVGGQVTVPPDSFGYSTWPGTETMGPLTSAETGGVSPPQQDTPMPTYSEPNSPFGGGGASPTPSTQGLFPPGWQTPIDDPGRAVRNYLRSQGTTVNPFNQSMTRAVNQFAGGLLPHFAAYSLGGGTDQNRTQEEEFSRFIGERLGGQRGPMSMGQATSELGGLHDLIQGVSRQAAGVQGADMSTPEGRAAALAQLQGQGTYSPMQLGWAGQFLTPDSQAALYLGSYLPMLGPALASSLSRAIAPQREAWSDYQEQLAGGTQGSTFMNLLSRLLGRF